MCVHTQKGREGHSCTVSGGNSVGAFFVISIYLTWGEGPFSISLFCGWREVSIPVFWETVVVVSGDQHGLPVLSVCPSFCLVFHSGFSQQPQAVHLPGACCLAPYQWWVHQAAQTSFADLCHATDPKALRDSWNWSQGIIQVKVLRSSNGIICKHVHFKAFGPLILRNVSATDHSSKRQKIAFLLWMMHWITQAM